MCLHLGSGEAEAAQQQAKHRAAVMAQRIKHEEAARQMDIRRGEGIIDRDFGRFDNKYFDGYKTSYVDAYNPQVDTQFDAAKGAATASLADRGVLNSSIAGNALGKLAETYGNARAEVASGADNAAGALRGRINDSKSNLYALNSSAADPRQTANQASASAYSLVPNRQFSPLGDIFSGALGPILAAGKANAYSPYPMGLPGFKVAGTGSSSSLTG